MKVLHCSDIHLDSPMGSHLSAGDARKRKLELIQAFKSMAEYADNENVNTIIIAGDLFDTNRIAVSARNAVIETIRKYPGISWYYLKGNHDKNDFLNDMDDIPDNLFTFDENWKTYDLSDKVRLTGIEVSKENCGSMYASLNLNFDKFNIVTLHGQESASAAKDKAEILNIAALKNQHIDYLALGHVHSFKYEALDGRGFYCYPGCLEARGFDECGKHGFVVIDINEDKRTFSYKFVSNPIRSAHRLEVNISNLSCSSDIVSRITKDLSEKGYKSTDMLEVVLAGEVDYDSEKNIDYIADQFSGKYFAFKLKDRTTFKIDFEAFRNDKSLKGTFVRLVEGKSDLTDDDKAKIIRFGIQALRREEVQ